MRNLGLLNEKTVMTGMSGKKVDEGWADFNGLTLIRPNKWAGPGGNSQNSFFGPSSSSNKHTIQPRPGPHGLNSNRPLFARPKAHEGVCTHYGKNKQTKDTCFQLHEYSKWWYELKGKKDA